MWSFCNQRISSSKVKATYSYFSALDEKYRIACSYCKLLRSFSLISRSIDMIRDTSYSFDKTSWLIIYESPLPNQSMILQTQSVKTGLKGALGLSVWTCFSSKIYSACIDLSSFEITYGASVLTLFSKFDCWSSSIYFHQCSVSQEGQWYFNTSGILP